MKEKKSAHLVDPELKAFLNVMPELHLTNETLPFVRDQAGSLIKMTIPQNLPVEVSEKFIAGRPGDPDVKVIIFTPRDAATPRPAYLDIHGGGMVSGSADDMIAPNMYKALEIGCSIVSVDYRLAPETRHPGPVEDCYAALKWMNEHADELGIDRERIAIGGGSAGGGIAAGLALLARDRREVNIIFQDLFIPMLDDRTCIAEPHPYAGEYIWLLENNRFGWSALLGCEPGSEGVSPYASAARAEDLSGLPSTIITIGALDLFVDECLDYAKRLNRAGVPTELHVYPGVYHGAASESRVLMAMHRDRTEALRRAFYG